MPKRVPRSQKRITAYFGGSDAPPIRRRIQQRKRCKVHIDFWSSYRADFGYNFSKEGDWENDNYYGYGHGLIPHGSDTVCVSVLWNGQTFGKFSHKFVTECTDPRPIFLQLHSHINGFGPFEATGYTGNYKETGEYSAPTTVTCPSVRAVSSDEYYNSPAVAIAVDKQGNVVSHMSINPPE